MGDRREHYVFLAGAISGVVEGATIQPLEMLKTRAQINTGAHMRLIPAAREIIKEGGVLQFYRGALPEISGEAHGSCMLHGDSWVRSTKHLHRVQLCMH